MDASQDIRTKTGGAYIPPARLRMMQQSISDKNSEAYQRLSWEALKKSINGLINKVNIANIELMVRELFQINLIRGRGLFCRAIMRAQMSSPTFTHVYAALISVCNSKFPTVGSLLLKRLIVQFRQSFQRNDKEKCINTARFIAHLVNQSMAHELIALEILILLLDNATNDSVEVAIAFLKECGAKLEDVARKAIAAIFESLRNILHDAELNKRVQYMIEVMFAVRKDKFKDHPSVAKELDLVEECDQITHSLELGDDYDLEEKLNVFKLDDKFQENEARYEQIKNDILGDDSGESGSGSSGSESDDEDDGSDEDGEGGDPGPTGTTDSNVIIDNTETNLITLRKTIYLTIQSSLDFEECAHKLLRLEVKPEQYPELCNMIVDCCAQQRTYIKFFGLLAQRFCQINMEYIKPFEDIFKNCYDTIHRFETCKLRNVAKLFAHLLHTDAIPWTVLSHIKLNEYDTTSSSRVFIKILFQQLAESLGLVKLNARIKDATLQEAFDGLFPRDEPQNTRFAINFFTSIGLGGLTDDLREHLKTAATKQPASGLENLANKVKKEEITSSDDSSSSSSDDSSSSSSDSSDSSSTSDEDSDTEESSDEESDNSRRNKRSKLHSIPSSSSKKRRSPERNENRKRDSHRESRSDRHRKDRREENRDRREEDFGRRVRVRQGHDLESPDQHRSRERNDKPDDRRHLQERNGRSSRRLPKRESDDDDFDEMYKKRRIQSRVEKAHSPDQRRNRTPSRSVSPNRDNKRRRH